MPRSRSGIPQMATRNLRTTDWCVHLSRKEENARAENYEVQMASTQIVKSEPKFNDSYIYYSREVKYGNQRPFC